MNLLKDEVSVLVRKLAIPASIGTLFQTLYTIVDTFYAGKISPEALSALSKSFPIYFIIIATSIGVTVAGTSLIGSSRGEKNEKNVLSYFGNVIIYAVIISFIVSLLGFTFGEKVFLLMNSSNEVTGLETIAKEIYRADEVIADTKIRDQLKSFEEAGFGELPICVAKTQYSFSTDPNLKWAPTGHSLPIREIRLSSGAEFIVVVCGAIMTMPGLPRVPAADSIKLNKDGEIEGLF